MRTWIIATVAGIALVTAASHAPDARAQDETSESEQLIDELVQDPCIGVAEAIERYRSVVEPARKAWMKAETAWLMAPRSADRDALRSVSADVQRKYKEIEAAQKAIYIKTLRELYDGPRSGDPQVMNRLVGQFEMQCARQFGYGK